MNDRFVGLLSEVQRPGIDKLLEWLEKSDFYTSPASTKHHGAIEGGLLSHSLAVYDALLKITEAFGVSATPETKVIVALTHDLCKVNTYKIGTKNVQNQETKKWEPTQYYFVEDKLPLGHGEKSVILLQAFIRPTIEEIMAIRWHMSGFDDAARGGWGGSAALSAAYKQYPLAVALHLADMADSYFEKR